MNGKNRAENVILSVILVFFWAVIFAATYLVRLLSDLFRYAWGGTMPYLFALLYLLAFLIPILLRKRLNGILSMPAAMVLSTITAAATALILLAGVRTYMSDFTPTKWEKNPQLRTYMLEDLEQDHSLVGKSEEKIAALLGEPTDILSETVWEYYIGPGFMDPYGYRITFENGVVASSEIIEH